MNKRCIVFLLFALLISGWADAQPYLYFVNRAKHKVIEVKTGNQLSIRHIGYLGQTEFARQTVTDINDSMVTLGVDPARVGGFLQKSLENNPKFVYRKVLIRDIVAFRRITAARQLFKSGLMIGNIFGTYFLLTDLYRNSNFSVGQTFLISFGVGIGTTLIINSLFPENPKYKMEDGWEAITADTPPKL